MSQADGFPQMNRARTAIVRAGLSRPVRCAISDGLIKSDTHLFDYGCGRGGDIKGLQALGYAASGWDPIHLPDANRRRSPVVNLSYVVNVIEDSGERSETLCKAWALAEGILIVSARVASEGRALRSSSTFKDGLITSRGTFQKFFGQQELRHWIEETLQVKAVAAAPGIFYVFRNDQARFDFIAARFRRRRHAPRLANSHDLFSAHRPLLGPLTHV